MTQKQPHSFVLMTVVVNRSGSTLGRLRYLQVVEEPEPDDGVLFRTWAILDAGSGDGSPAWSS